VQEEFDKAVEEGRRRLSPLEKRRALEAQRRAQQAKRKADAALTKELAEALGTSRRFALIARTEGTTEPETARIMARVLGTDPKDHLRERSRTRRQMDLPNWFMRLWVPQGTFRDFLADEVELAEAVATVVRALRAQKGDDWIRQGDINSLEKLVLHLRSVDQSDAAASAAAIWKAFKLWKIELVATMATRTVKEDLWTDATLHSNHWRANRS
jgi:hypothetical protein